MDFLNGSIRVGSLFGVNVRVHVLWLIWIAFNLIDAGPAWRREAQSLGLLFGIVLLHEFGHCFGARAVGGDARDILMWPLGGLAYAQAPMRPWPQFVTIAAGPLVNVLLCLLSAAVLRVFPDLPSTSRAYVHIFYEVNFFLLAFNLLPIYPMDGGQLLQTLIWPFLGLRRATLVACYIGLAGCVLLGLWGVRGGGMLLFIAIFGALTCYQRLRMLRAGLLVDDDRFATYDAAGRYARRRGFWSRLFRRAGGPRPTAPLEHPYGRPSPNPNPGAWEAHLAEREREEAELDRILKKVSEHGIHSLSYVERQTLERVTRQRREEERSVHHPPPS